MGFHLAEPKRCNQPSAAKPEVERPGFADECRESVVLIKVPGVLILRVPDQRVGRHIAPCLEATINGTGEQQLPDALPV